MHQLLFSIWFFLPAGIANASPVFSTKIGFLNWFNRPMDFNKKLKGVRLLGDNKTWVGIIFATFVGLVVIALQKYGFNHSGFIVSISGSVNYSLNKIWWLGPLLGFGALFGDAVESFIKRQLKFKPGQRFFPFDQIDYILGGLIFSLLVVRLTFAQYLLILVVWFGLHLITTYIGYLVGLRSKPI